LGRLVERFGTSDWGRLFVVAAAAFGTFLTTFAVTINNHLPAAVCAAITLCAVVPILFDDRRRLRDFALAGFFGAFMFANELPSLALFAPLSLILLWKAPRQTLLAYLPAALIVLAASFTTNWIAHKSLLPAYVQQGREQSERNWYDYSYIRNGRVVDSFWRNPQGIDKGETSFAAYATNFTVGHHGVFSLTPIWLLSVAGGLMWLLNEDRDRRLRLLALLIFFASLACFGFYILNWKSYGNYGGMTSGPRWMFWFAPLWLVLMLPAADFIARRAWTRGAALVLLALSVISASYPTWNPWTNPWLMDFFHYLGWI
jgi:hypothetical protein